MEKVYLYLIAFVYICFECREFKDEFQTNNRNY